MSVKEVDFECLDGLGGFRKYCLGCGAKLIMGSHSCDECEWLDEEYYISVEVIAVAIREMVIRFKVGPRMLFSQEELREAIK